MQEIISQVVEKTGLSEELATKAVDVVVGILKDKLPDSISSNLDGLLAGGSAMDIAKGLAGDKLGNLFS